MQIDSDFLVFLWLLTSLLRKHKYGSPTEDDDVFDVKEMAYSSTLIVGINGVFDIFRDFQ